MTSVGHPWDKVCCVGCVHDCTKSTSIAWSTLMESIILSSFLSKLEIGLD